MEKPEPVAVKLVLCPVLLENVPVLLKSPPTERVFPPMDRVDEDWMSTSPSGLPVVAAGAVETGPPGVKVLPVQMMSLLPEATKRFLSVTVNLISESPPESY